MSVENKKLASDVIKQLDKVMKLIDDELEEAYEEYAEAKRISSYLQSMKGPTFSECIERSAGKNISQKKIDAEQDPAYKSFLIGLGNAIGEEQRTRGRVEFLKIKIEAIRTSISLQKALL